MGLLARVVQVMADKYEADTESRAEFNEGIRAMFARGGPPDTIREQMAAYHAEVLAASGVDLSSYSDSELAAMFDL